MPWQPPTRLALKCLTIALRIYTFRVYKVVRTGVSLSTFHSKVQNIIESISVVPNSYREEDGFQNAIGFYYLYGFAIRGVLCSAG